MTPPEIAYDVAYFVLPHYVFKDVSRVREVVTESPRVAAAYFYTMACVTSDVEPDREVALAFRWHQGRLDSSRHFMVLEFPAPPPVDLSGVPLEDLAAGAARKVLAPHFSAIVSDEAGNSVRYYVLGQAPIGGGTTLRSVSADGVNSNLGPGPEPVLEALLDAIRSALGGRVLH